MGVFDYTIRCCIGDYQETIKYTSKLFGGIDIPQDNVTVGDAPRGCCIFNTEFIPVVWIPHYPKTPREYATLAHECLHAVMHMFRWAALPFTDDTEEVMTHSLSHLITNILTKGDKVDK